MDEIASMNDLKGLSSDVGAQHGQYTYSRLRKEMGKMTDSVITPEMIEAHTKVLREQIPLVLKFEGAATYTIMAAIEDVSEAALTAALALQRVGYSDGYEQCRKDMTEGLEATQKRLAEEAHMEAALALHKPTIPEEIEELAQRVERWSHVISAPTEPRFKQDLADGAAALRSLVLEVERLREGVDAKLRDLENTQQRARIAQLEVEVEGLKADSRYQMWKEQRERIKELEAECEETRDSVGAVRAEYLQRWMDALERIKELEAEKLELAKAGMTRQKAIEAATIERCAKWLEDRPEHWRMLAADMRRALATGETKP